MTTLEEPSDAQTPDARQAAPSQDAARFLDEYLAASPVLADMALEGEVSSLLGRAPKWMERRPERKFTPVNERFADDSGAQRFDWYVSIAAQLPPLDDEYFPEAARRVEIGLLAEERIAASDLSAVSRRELSDLHTLARQGREAWEWLVLTNLRLVFHWSRGVARSVDPDWAQDAFQVGCIGLMRGLQGWDYTMGYKLSTFVSWHVRQAIQRWRANDVMIIRVPVHVWEALGADESDLTEKLREAAERAQDLASLEAMFFDRGEDIEWDGGIAALEARIDRERLVGSLLEGLNERTRDIIERRFGMRDDIDGPMTLDDIGAVWNVTRERIRQVEKKTMEALRAKALGLPFEQAVKRKRRKKVASDVPD